MNKKELSYIITREFPNIIGAMITGSQSRNSEFRRGYDIDIVLFDLLYPRVATFEMFYEGIKIDCTIVPVSNINGALVNEFGDQKGVLFKMIAHGEYLTGNQVIIEDIKKNTIDFLQTLEKDFNPHTNKQLLELRWIAKYLERKLSKEEIFMLLCEFVCAITTLESYKTDFWLNTHLRKVEELSKKSQGFLLSTKEHFDYAVTTQDCRPVIQYIHEYLENYPSVADTNTFYILTINVPEFYKNTFASKIIPLLRSNELLGQTYKYFFFTNSQSDKLLKNNCCVCFDLVNGVLIKDIIKELKSVLVTFNLQLEYQIVSLPMYVRKAEASKEIIAFKSTLCSSFGILRNEYSAEEFPRQIQCFIRKFAQCIEIDDFDYRKSLELLIARYLFYKNDFKHVGVKDFEAYFDKQYTEEYSAFISFYAGSIGSSISDNCYDEMNIETALQVLNLQNTRLLPFLNDSVLDILMINDSKKVHSFIYFCETVFTISSATEKDNLWVLFRLLEQKK